MHASSYQIVIHLLRSLKIKFGLSLWTEIRVPSTYSHQSIPHLLLFYSFLLNEVYSPSIQVVTWMLSACSHQSVPSLLHSLDHQNTRSLYSRGFLSDPRLPQDRYTPFLLINMGFFLGVGSVPLTMSQSVILPGVEFVPPTTGRSISGVFFEGFRLWTGSAPLAFYNAFTIFSWKLGIMVVSDNAF